MARGVQPVRDDLNIGLLRLASYRAIEQRVFRALAAAGLDDCTPSQARVMQRIGPGGTRLTELAQAAQVTKQTVGFLVDQLERSGYVRRQADPSDGPARLMHIAERRGAARPVAAAAVAEVETELRAHLGQRQWNQLDQALTRLREITDPYR